MRPEFLYSYMQWNDAPSPFAVAASSSIFHSQVGFSIVRVIFLGLNPHFLTRNPPHGRGVASSGVRCFRQDLRGVLFGALGFQHIRSHGFRQKNLSGAAAEIARGDIPKPQTRKFRV